MLFLLLLLLFLFESCSMRKRNCFLPDNLFFFLIRLFVNWLMKLTKPIGRKLRSVGFISFIFPRKDEVIGKTVKSEDISRRHTAFYTELIVKYMTQNSLGRLWLENNCIHRLPKRWNFISNQGKTNPKSRIPNPKSQSLSLQDS